MACKGCGRLFFRCLCCQSSQASRTVTTDGCLSATEVDGESAPVKTLPNDQEGRLVDKDSQTNDRKNQLDGQGQTKSPIDEAANKPEVILDPIDCDERDDKDEDEGDEEGQSKGNVGRRLSDGLWTARGWLSRLWRSDKRAAHKFGNYRPTRNYKHRKAPSKTSETTCKVKIPSVVLEEKTDDQQVSTSATGSEASTDRKARFAKITFIDEPVEGSNASK
jgi:hypothetical protein